jgi:hypothetical protein
LIPTRNPHRPPTTVAGFRRDAEAAFRRRNPDAENVRLVWTEQPRAVVFPTGKRGFVGTLRVASPGYAVRIFHVTLCGNVLAGGF